MSLMNNMQDEITFYNRSNYSVKLKVIISILLGIICLLLSPYGFKGAAGDVIIDIPWSLVLPILVALAFGWRYGLLSALSGAAIFPFFLSTENGWANFLTTFLYSLFFTSIGLVNGMNESKGSRLIFYRYLAIFSTFFIVLILSYHYLFNYLLAFNSATWNFHTINALDHKILRLFIVKDCVNLLSLTILCDLLLRLQKVRRLLGIPVSSIMSFNRFIFVHSLIVCFVIWLSYLGLSLVLLKHDGFMDGHFPLAFFVIFIGGCIAARIIIYYTERQFYGYNKQKESETYLKLQIEKMPIGYIVWDDELRVKRWNPSAEEIFGFTSAEVLGKTAYETIVPKHIKENISKIWHDLRFKGIEAHNINENSTKNGETIICEWTNTPIKDDEGNTIEIISMVQNITIRKKVEDCLQFIALHEWNDINDNFFHSITQYIGKNLNLDYVLVSKVAEGECIAETLSYYVGGKIISNKKYDIHKTPCENVYGKKTCIYPSSIQKLFPEDVTLVKMNAESYVGQPLWDSNGNPLGLIACISKREIKNSDLIIPILNIIATRVSSEMVRKQSKDLLESSETKYRLLFENMTSGFALHEMIYDESGKAIDYRFISVNPSFERLTGMSASDTIGKRVKDFLPNLEPYWIETYANVVLTGKPITYQNYSKDINKHFDTWVFSPQKNHFAVVFNDITERIKAEKAVKESEANLNSLINNRKDSIWSIDKDYQFITVNTFFKDQYLSFFNIELKKGMNAIDTIAPELQPLWKSKYDLAFTGQRVVFEFSIENGMNSLFFEVFLNPILSDDNITGVSALSVDITERKQKEIKLQESEFFFKETQRAGFIGSYKTDFVKGLWESSDVLDQIFGIDKDYKRSISGWLDIIHPDDRDMMNNYLMDDIIKKRIAFNKEYRIKRIFDGETRWVLGLGVTDFDLNGNILSLIGTIQDITERKMIDDAFKRSEFRISNILKTALDGFWISDLKGKILDVNDAFIQMIGFSREELLNMSVPDIEVLENEKEVLSRIQYIINCGNQRFESKHRCKDGRVIDVEVSINYIPDDQVFIVFVDDISDRMRSFEAIRESKANLSAIIENTMDSIWAINTEYEILFINNVFKQDYLSNFGVQLEVGMNILNSSPDALRQVWKSRYDRAFNNERFVLEDRIDLGFTDKYIELAVNPIAVEGKVVGASLFSRDITQRKKAAEALRASEERFKTVTESAEEWIWEVDKNGLYTYSNQVVEKLIGFKPDEIVGKKYFFDFFDPEIKDHYKESTFNTFANILAFKDFENINIHKDGKKVVLKTTGSPILNDNGELLGYRGADIDITIQKRIETALLESEEKYRLTFITSPDSVNINRMDGAYIEINEGFTRLTGYTREDVIGLTSLEIDIWYYPDDRKKLIKGLNKKGYVDNLESVFRCKDGTLKTALMSARIITINNSPHILSITRDITERKLLEDALVKNEEKYRKLFERSNDAIFVIDKNTGRYLDANKSAERITGYKLSELKKFSITDITSIDSKKRLSRINHITKTVDLGEIEYFRPDGTLRIATLSAVPLSEDKIYGIAHDITERKQYEDALSILSNAVDQSPVSVQITDTKGIIEYVNPKFIEITGYNLDEVIGKKPNILKSGYTSENEYKKLWDTISSGKEWRGELCNLKKNGEKFWESALISPITNETGKITHYLAIKEDITEKKETDRIILSSIIETEEKERSRFSRELHDGLGPLLSTIKLYFQWLSETVDLDKKKIIIEKGDKNLNEAIESIREISNNLSPRTLNSFGAIVALRNFIDNVNHAQKIFIEFNANTESRFEKNVETVLYRVTSELINNTLKYAKATKSDVKIHYEVGEGIIKLTYRDNGIGFNMHEVFNNRKGLGFVNIEQRVNALEGKFKITSSEGNGVFVEIELPALKH